ncbi:hypothetical protein COOONC_05321 [Cooperia oncophora]
MHEVILARKHSPQFQRILGTTHTDGTEPVVLADSPYDEPTTLAASIGHRLSSSVGEVLHQAGAGDLESCESDFLRPLTSCEGDSSRSFTYLEWVHENQARGECGAVADMSLRTCSTSSPKNNCSCTMSSSGLPSSCGVRRRSWRVRSLKGNLLGLKTHSLDSPEPPVLPSQRVSGKTMYSRSLAHSIGGETWVMEVISDEIWKKKRSVKKKH